jgi:hypothetical protein
MKQLALSILRKFLKRDVLKLWRLRDFASPAPHEVKISVLKRYGGTNTWIETGTYLGDTTNVISEFAAKVITIEPSPLFSSKAKVRFREIQNVQVVEGTSEDNLAALLEDLNLDESTDISFWLDGHFSGGETFQGEADTPVMSELEVIKQFSKRMQKFTVLVDDVRCFTSVSSEYVSYPKLLELVSWADELGLFWSIEHDIFIASNRLKLTNEAKN